MTRIPVPKKVSFSTAHGTTYSTHYANFVLPGTNISLSAYILEESRMLLSVCQLCLHEGLGFLNVPGKTPALILPDGGVIECLILQGQHQVDFNHPKCFPKRGRTIPTWIDIKLPEAGK